MNFLKLVEQKMDRKDEKLGNKLNAIIEQMKSRHSVHDRLTSIW